MVSRERFEPPTCPLGGGRSIQLSYRDIIHIDSIAKSDDKRCARYLHDRLTTLEQSLCGKFPKMNTENTSSAEGERREYTRVQDAVGLTIQKLTEMPAAGTGASVQSSLKVRKRDKYDIQGYASVRRDFPAVASYIDQLEERIRQLLLDGDSTKSKPTHKVSLSAGGVHFADSILLRPGELIGITITLFPSGRQISTDARILDGNEAPEVAKRDEPSYRALFVRMSEADHEAIEAHVQKILEKSSLIKT